VETKFLSYPSFLTGKSEGSVCTFLYNPRSWCNGTPSPPFFITRAGIAISLAVGNDDGTFVLPLFFSLLWSNKNTPPPPPPFPPHSSETANRKRIGNFTLPFPQTGWWRRRRPFLSLSFPLFPPSVLRKVWRLGKRRISSILPSIPSPFSDGKEYGQHPPFLPFSPLFPPFAGKRLAMKELGPHFILILFSSRVGSFPFFFLSPFSFLLLSLLFPSYNGRDRGKPSSSVPSLPFSTGGWKRRFSLLFFSPLRERKSRSIHMKPILLIPLPLFPPLWIPGILAWRCSFPPSPFIFFSCKTSAIRRRMKCARCASEHFSPLSLSKNMRVPVFSYPPPPFSPLPPRGSREEKRLRGLKKAETGIPLLFTLPSFPFHSVSWAQMGLFFFFFPPFLSSFP